MSTPLDWHVYPVRDLVDHDLETRGCWCSPRAFIHCPECSEPDPTCWRCGGDRKVEVAVEALAPVIVVHNAADGRE